MNKNKTLNNTKIKTLLIILLFAIFFTGCNKHVVSNLSVVHNLKNSKNNQVVEYSFILLDDKKDNLEYQLYKEKVKLYLLKNNYIEVANSKNLIVINYGITKKDHNFVRFFDLTIYNNILMKKLYEAKITSEGSSNKLATVIDQMIEALFIDFPGKSGESKEISIKIKT